MNNNNGTGHPMDNLNLNIEKFLDANTKSTKDYILLFRNNLKSVILISFVIIVLTVIYAITAQKIYKSSVNIKITRSSQNVLETTQENFSNDILDRYIANEIGIINNYSTREKFASAIIDSFKISKSKDLFYLVKSQKDEGPDDHKTIKQLASLLEDIIEVEQNAGMDIIELSVESPSPFESALIANICASEYQKINLEANREKFTTIRKFLEKQAQDKLVELRSSEDSLAKFQEKGGIISFDIQSNELITQLSQLDAQKEATQIELSTSNEVLKQYKFFLRKQDPQLVDYLENQTSQAYINALQQQLAELQVDRDLAVSIKTSNVDISAKVKDYDQRISELKEKLSSTINGIKADAFSGNPDQVSDLAQRLIDEEIRNSTLSVRLTQLEEATRKYEGGIRRLPKTSTVLSQYQRDRESLQQLFLQINEQYQQALINELSQTGNAFIINSAKIPDGSVKPNRKLIILFGFLLGPMVAFVYLLIKDHFDDTVKTPEDIEKNDIKFLSWIPHYKENGKKRSDNIEFAILDEQDSPISESFRAIKSRLQQSRTDSEILKIILVTSPAECEGKSFVSVNLACSFAQSNKRTLIIDCDLRRPTIHVTMGVDKKPGLVDYLSRKVKLEEIIRETKINNLNYITSGSIPSNPAEVLESKMMNNFLHEIKDFFEVIIIDSPPIVAVIDSELLAKLVDGTILVISADKTEKRLMTDAVEIIKRNKVHFLGTVLNNFKYKSGYGYYYKYYYNYSRHSSQKLGKKHKI
jgi:tyrosine-protein kinase Etk/Wzc